MKHFDLIVIGAGSGGVRCARIAAQHGARVGIAEGRHWGGTCVNIGCVPKKLMVYASAFKEDFSQARAYGWDVTLGAHDWAKLRDAKDREISRLNQIYVSMLEKSGVDLFRGCARLLGPHRVAISPSPLKSEAQNEIISADRIVIATGGMPVRPNIEGAEFGIVSDDVFRLDACPKRVVIIGAGYIGVEFAGIFAGLGAKVDLLYRGALPLRGFDTELRENLHDAFAQHNITFHANSELARIESTASSARRVVLSNGASLEADCVLFATGRRPNIEGLGLEKTCVVIDAGRIVVDDTAQTSEPSIYAIGDVTNQLNLTPVAIAEGHSLSDRLFAQKAHPWDATAVPKAVFFTDAVASVGLTEDEAAQEYDLEVYTARFTPLKHALSQRGSKTFIKLIVDAASQRVLGAHMIGEPAAEIIQGLAIAVASRLTKRDFDRTVGLHPTTAEEFVTLRTPTRRVAKKSA